MNNAVYSTVSVVTGSTACCAPKAMSDRQLKHAAQIFSRFGLIEDMRSSLGLRIRWVELHTDFRVYGCWAAISWPLSDAKADCMGAGMM